MKKISFAFALVICLGLWFPQQSHASFYKYIDKDGVVCFADNLQAVPEQFRASAVLVQEEQQEEYKPGTPPVTKTETAPIAPAVQPQPVVNAPLPLSFRLGISAAVGIVAILLFVFAKSVPQLKQNPGALITIRGVLILGVSIYVVFAHVDDVMVMFGKASQKIDETQQKSADRGKKAARAMKQLNESVSEAQQVEKDQAAQLQEMDSHGK